MVGFDLFWVFTCILCFNVLDYVGGACSLLVLGWCLTGT